jgi:hypothetical protein
VKEKEGPTTKGRREKVDALRKKKKGGRDPVGPSSRRPHPSERTNVKKVMGAHLKQRTRVKKESPAW